MPFVIDPGSDATSEVRRVLGEQLAIATGNLDRALADYTHLEPGVHATRKACKRLRATFSLVRLPKRWQHRARDASRPLSPVRDAHVLAKLAVRYGAPSPPLPPDTVQRVERARGLLDEIRIDVPALNGDTLRRGFDKGMRRATSMLAAARATDDLEAVHDLRKAVKAHGYHTQLLRHRVDPVRIDALDALQEQLGDFNDLSVLRGLMAHDADVVARIDVRQHQLRIMCIEAAGSLF